MDEKRREIINPHDKMTIDCSDLEAARLAVILVGQGGCAIEDDDMPLFLFADFEGWVQSEYGVSGAEWIERVERERIIKALRSWRLEHERSSMSDPTARAHRIAARMEGEAAP